MSLTQLLSLIILFLLAIIGYLLLTDSNGSIDENELTQLVLDYNEDPIVTMNNTVAEKMIENYRVNQLSKINEAFGDTPEWDDLGDANSVYFSLEKLKKIIYHTEINVKSLFKEEVHPELGIKFYFAAYPSDDPIYAKRQTLVMVPSYVNPSNQHVDFDANNPPNMGDWNGEATDIFQSSSETSRSFVNKGTLFPPMN